MLTYFCALIINYELKKYISILSKVWIVITLVRFCDEYSTDRIFELTRHLLRKKQCMKSIKSFDYSNDQLIILSLIPNKEIDNLKTEINHIDKNNNLITKNKLELLDIIKLIDKQKLKKCTLCNKDFSKISELFIVVVGSKNNICNSLFSSFLIKTKFLWP